MKPKTYEGFWLGQRQSWVSRCSRCGTICFSKEQEEEHNLNDCQKVKLRPLSPEETANPPGMNLKLKVLRHISVFKSRPVMPLLDVLHGSKALSLRTQVAALMLGRKVTGSDKEAQYNNLRQALLSAVGATGDCTAAEDADFERKAAKILADE